jgi:hypothetical protein
MNTQARIIGSHGFFFRDGDAFTVPGAGTAGRSAKPGATDPEWIDMGVIDSSGITNTSEEREIYAPTPGQLRLYDSIPTKNKLEGKITCEELSALSWELLFGTLPLTPDGANQQYNPQAQIQKKGWLKIQQYDQSDALFNTVDIYVRIKVDGEVKFDDNIVKVNLAAMVLFSTLNTGQLA